MAMVTIPTSPRTPREKQEQDPALNIMLDGMITGCAAGLLGMSFTLVPTATLAGSILSGLLTLDTEQKTSRIALISLGGVIAYLGKSFPGSSF